MITSTKRSEQAGAKKTKTFTEWIEGRRSLGADPIAGTDEVFAYAQHAGISVELIELHWLEFKTRYADSDRRQRQWPKAFRDSVRANSYRLWWVPPYQPAELTSVGRQAQAAHAAQAGADYDKTPRRQVSTPPMGPSVSAAHAGNPTPDKSLVGELVVCAG